MSPSEMFECGCDPLSGQCPTHAAKDKQAEANARLIAAAPRMLEFITEIAAKGYVANQIVTARAILRDVEGV